MPCFECGVSRVPVHSAGPADSAALVGLWTAVVTTTSCCRHSLSVDVGKRLLCFFIPPLTFSGSSKFCPDTVCDLTWCKNQSQSSRIKILRVQLFSCSYINACICCVPVHSDWDGCLPSSGAAPWLRLQTVYWKDTVRQSVSRFQRWWQGCVQLWSTWISHQSTWCSSCWQPHQRWTPS